nr:NAD(P)/FAD-dependent oxidoreductase [Rhizomicrobium electricum]
MTSMVAYCTRSEFDVIVIGAGIGGLTAASLLAARGLKVLVAETHYQCGGNCTSWRRRVAGHPGLFTFDSGVQDISGLGPSGPVTNLLGQIGASIAWERVHHLYWIDGIRVAAGQSQQAFEDALCAAFPAQAEGIRRFMAEMAAIYRDLYADVGRTGGIPVPPRLEDLRAWNASHPSAARWMRERFADMLRTFTNDDCLHTLLQTVSEYIAATPDNLSVHDMAPLYGYYFEGGRYPRGGSQTIADTLARSVDDHGGRIATKTRIAEIMIEGGRVAGVRTVAGEVFSAPVVIANGDVVTMLTGLTDPQHLPAGYARRVNGLRRGPSAVLVSLGLDAVMDLPPRIFIRKGDLAFGVGNPSVLDPKLAPPGCSAVTLLLLLSEAEAAAWPSKTDPSYRAHKNGVVNRLIDVVEQSVFPDLSRHIIYREAATPATFTTFTGARNGNIYGAARAVWRPRMQTPIPGLYLAGAGTDTGAGIEAVVISGTRVANAICEGGQVCE